MAGLVGGPGADSPGRRRIFENLQNIFLKKIAKNAFLKHIFQKGLTNHEFIIRAFRRKTQILGKFLRNFRKFSNDFFRKFRKFHYLSIFSKNLTNHALIFLAFGRKLQIVGKFWQKYGNFWWKFNRKIAFLSILGKVVAKNRAFGNNIIFLQQFFSGSGGLNPQPPCVRHCFLRIWIVWFPTDKTNFEILTIFHKCVIKIHENYLLFLSE